MIKITIPGMDDFIKDLKDESAKAITKATISTINKLAAQGKTAASKEIREYINIKAGDLGKSLNISPATPNKDKAEIIGKGKAGIPLISFGGKWTRPTMGKRGKMKGSTIGASWQIKMGGVRTIGPHTFIAKMKSGHIGIFERIPGTHMLSNKHKEQIKQLFGLQPALLLGIPRVVNAVRNLVKEKAVDIFTHEFDFFKNK